MSLRLFPLLLLLPFLAAACGAIGLSGSPSDGQASEYEIVTLLPRDAIPSIDNPRFYSASKADLEYGPDERVIGLEIDGEARAYPTGLLSSHEIVNDSISGRPIAVTW